MTRRTGVAAFAVALTIVLFTGAASAAPGQLDPSFDGDGTAAYGAGSTFAEGVHVQPSGRIVTVSSASGSAQLVAFTASGALDAPFGSGGVAVLPGLTAHTTTMAADGRVGVLTSDGVAQFTANGVLDSGFGAAGIAALPDWFHAQDVAAFPDGGYALIGQDERTCNRFHTLCNGALARLAPTGSLNWAKTLGAAVAGGVVAIDRLGRIVTNVAGVSVFLGVGGTPDPTFGVNGTVSPILYPAGTFITTTDITTDQLGRIILAGTERRASVPGSAPQLVAQRVLPNGVLDTNFGAGTDGVARASLPGTITVRTWARVALVPNGRIVVTGVACVPTPSACTSHLYTVKVARFLKAGDLDTGFGAAGVVTGPTNPEKYALVPVAAQPDGKPLVLSGGDAGLALMRLLAT